MRISVCGAERTALSFGHARSVKRWCHANSILMILWISMRPASHQISRTGELT